MHKRYPISEEEVNRRLMDETTATVSTATAQKRSAIVQLIHTIRCVLEQTEMSSPKI